MRFFVPFAVGCCLALVVGCKTPTQVAQMEGQGRTEVYNASFQEVWRAAVDAAQQGDLQVRQADRAQGYIAAGRGMRLATHGENVGIWVREVAPRQTRVEVVSRQAGPPKFWFKNWEDEILNSISANLTREIGRYPAGEPAGAEIQHRSSELIDPPPVSPPPVHNDVYR